MSIGKNKTKLISLLLDQWTTDKYVTRLVDRNLSQVIDEEVFRLTCKVDKIQEEAGMFILLIDFSLTVKAATLIFIPGCGSAISSAKEGKSGSNYNLVKN